jgi:glutathione synthase/RimK-type ligase-like ATP-grasp enzyme
VTRIALATCSEVADGDEDSPALVAALAARDIDAVPAVWDDPGVDWSVFELVVVRSTWDYAESRDQFLGWAASLPWVLNDVEVLRWNTDKRYLRRLDEAGVPVVPTSFVEPGEELTVLDGRFVVKPAVSAGARHAAVYGPGDVEQAREHVDRLHAMGRTMMIQPYLEAVDELGETEMVYLGGSYSHAVVKAALLRPGQAPGTGLYLEEDMRSTEPSGAERDVADRALAALASNSLLQARVDVAATPDGPVVLEVELTEPSLYLGYADGATERFADAISAAIRAR